MKFIKKILKEVVKLYLISIVMIAGIFSFLAQGSFKEDIQEIANNIQTYANVQVNLCLHFLAYVILIGFEILVLLEKNDVKKIKDFLKQIKEAFMQLIRKDIKLS